MEEVWKDVPGYEGIYEASNLGKIKSGILPDENETTLGAIKSDYLQVADSCSNEDINIMTIKTCDAGGGTYYVLKTKRWAFESVEEISNVLNDFINRFNLNNKTK